MDKEAEKKIISRAEVILVAPRNIECPICHSKVSHYDSMPRLKIDFDDIARKIDAISERFPSHSGDVIKIVLLVGQSGDCIYGHPVEYRGCKSPKEKPPFSVGAV